MAFADFHTHTIFSDGKSTVHEMAEAARAAGLLSLGISDHSLTPFDVRYCMRPQTNIQDYEKTVREEQKIAREQYGFPLLLGIEWDFGSEIDPALYDYTIGSVHYILKGEDWFPVDSGRDWQQRGINDMFGGNKLDFAKAYFEEVVTHAEKNKPTIIGHFDLLTKHALIEEENEDYLKIAKEALAETVKHVPLFEVNMGAIIRGLKKLPYPAVPLLEALHAYGGRVILSSDAHHAEKLAFGFGDALALLQQVGFTKISRLHNGGIVEENIADLL